MDCGLLFDFVKTASSKGLCPDDYLDELYDMMMLEVENFILLLLHEMAETCEENNMNTNLNGLSAGSQHADLRIIFLFFNTGE